EPPGKARRRWNQQGETDENHRHGPPKACRARQMKAGDHCSGVPNRPHGRMISTAAMMMKTNASANWLVTAYCSPKEYTSPTITEPTSEPTMLPRPPITLIAKASTSTSVSIEDPTAWLGATMTPPRAARQAPITNTAVNRRATLMPLALRSSESETAARMFRPSAVRYSIKYTPAAISIAAAIMTNE